uniref:Carboxylesterase type B domain-containing protein n=1 Tax=Acrobeloides nanus TaxID=290746 RepID=A0A914BZG4_9BILA
MGNSINLFHGPEVPSREVTTKYGKIVGRRMIQKSDRMVDAFLGIPFAKPPVAELRFKKPVPPEPWSDTLHATKFASRCVQLDPFFFVKYKLGPCSEDCLYLNVFTPVWEPPEGGFPVMVFIHGGGYCIDSAVKYGDIGICQHLVAPHGVVVVTIQYRLGYLGFFTTGDDACDENVALWDMTLALQWVQENIGAFNGDKNNVTIFGQSAGGASVDLLSLSPYSRDLFHKVVPMAGNASCEWAINNNAVEKSRLMALKNGITENDSHELIRRMREVPAMKLATGLGSDTTGGKMQTTIGPRIDGDFLPKTPIELRKEAPKKKRLTGICEAEGILSYVIHSKKYIEEIIAERIPEYEYPNFKELRDQALKIYLQPEERQDKDKYDHAIVKLYTDLFLASDTQTSVYENLEVENDATYLYSFDYVNPKSFGFLIGRHLPFIAPTHCTELAYLFGVGILVDFKFNEDDNKMIGIMTQMWTNFAKYGDPNGDPSKPESILPFQWEAASNEHPRRYLSIKLAPEMKDPFQEGRSEFWRNLKRHLR